MKFYNPLFVRYIFLISGLLITLLFFTACENYRIKSGWRDREIKIDGNIDNWTNNMQYLENENLNIGIANDNDFLYLCISMSNKSLARQIIMQGLTAWFNSAGINKGTLGIHYPIGIINMYSNVIKVLFGKNTDRSLNDALKNDFFRQQFDELEIFKSRNGKPAVYNVAGVMGTEVYITNYDEILTYELKLPLSKSTNYIASIAKNPGESVRLIFQTRENNIFENMNSDNGGGGDPGRTSGGRGRGMRGGGSSGGYKKQKAEPLSLEISVQLAKETLKSSL